MNRTRVLTQGFITTILMLFAVPHGPAAPEDNGNVLDRALTELGLTRDNFRPDPVDIMTGNSDGRRPPVLTALLAEPLDATYRVGTIEQRFRDRTDSPHRLYLRSCGMTGADIARGYLGNPFSETDEQLLGAVDPLAESLRALEEEAGEFDWAANLPAPAALPNPLRYELARVLMALRSAERFRKRALRNVEVEPEELMEQLRQIFADRHEDFDGEDYRLYIRKVEYEALYAGMLDLVAALEDFEDALKNMESLPALEWRQETPLGSIIISTLTKDSVYREEAPLFIYDRHGSDVYALGTPEEPLRSGISIVFDEQGDDLYRTFPGRGASGLFGYGIQWDNGGDDIYRGADLAQGSAVFGGALLLDRAGNDSYTAVRGSQAYGIAGTALLADFSGDDSYESVTASQATGEPYGAGVLFDGGGDDTYALQSEQVISRSAQSPSNNNSMGQGCGVGVRADLSDGRSLPGGTGLLMDVSGDDVYTGEVFCQGIGFLEGAGMLVDGGGSDRYTGVWYAQGAGAHRAAGVLLDRGNGDDVYTSSKYTALGAAHDLSTAFLLDEGGNDRYTGGNLAIGGTNDNGTAIFVDEAGDDVYTLTGESDHGIGAAKISHWGTSREASLGVALFFDLGGDDDYKTKRQEPANNATFRWPQKYPELNLRADLGLGIDGDDDSPFYTGPRTESTGYAEQKLRETWEKRRAYREEIKPLPTPTP